MAATAPPAAQPFIVTYNNLNAAPIPSYTPGTRIVIPANLRQTFDATAMDEIGGVISFSKQVPDTLIVNGTFIISGVGGSVNWLPILPTFRHNSYMIFHTHPPTAAGNYNAYSSADLIAFFHFMLSVRRTPGISINFALFTPTDIHFTFVDEVCFKLLKNLIKTIRNKIWSVQYHKDIYVTYANFTHSIQMFFSLIFDQIIQYFVGLANTHGSTDVQALTILDTISFMPITGSPSHHHFMRATASLQNHIATQNFQGIIIADPYLRSEFATDPILAQKLGIIGTYYFHQTINIRENFNIKMQGGANFTPEQKTSIFNNLGLFKTTSLSRHTIQPNQDIAIYCIDNLKIYNETVGWPRGPMPPLELPNINSAIPIQDGGAITTGAIVKISNDNQITTISPIRSSKPRTKRKSSKRRSTFKKNR
jgi:hypothetical protein